MKRPTRLGDIANIRKHFSKFTKLELLNYVCEMYLKLKMQKYKYPQGESSHDIYKVLLTMVKDFSQEHFCAVYLDNQMFIRKTKVHFIGSLDVSVFSTREIIRTAMEDKRVKYIVLAHNHPSAFVKPSNQDVQLHDLLKEACNTFQFIFLDDIVFNEVEYFSYRERCVM